LETGKSDETIYKLLESSFKSFPADVEILKKQVSFLRNAHVRKQAEKNAAPGSAPSAARMPAAEKQPLPSVLAPRQAAAALPDVPRKPTDRQGEQAPRPVAVAEPAGDIVHKDANGELISNPRILNVIKYVLDPDNIVKVMDSDFIDEDDEIEIPKIWQERVIAMRKALRAFFLENFTEKQLDSVKKSRTATNLRLQMYNVFYKVYGLPTQWKTFKVLIEEGKINKKDETTENWLPFSDFDKFFEGFRWTDGHKNALKVSLRIPLDKFKEEIAKRAPDGAGPT